MSNTFSFVSASGHGEVDALLFGTRWSDGPGVPITFSFPGSGSVWAATYSNPGEPYAGFAPLGAPQQQALRDSLLAWSSIAKVSFAEVPDAASGSGTLRFAYTSWNMNSSQMAYAYAPNASENGGDVWLNASLSGSIFASFSPGTFGKYVLLHEAGHALGLKHPHEASDFSAATLNAQRDSVFDSLMSYYAWPGVLLTRSNMDRVPAGPMALDIDALQLLYGANTSVRGGDDVYAFDGGGKYLETLYDTGGNDTILLSGSAGGEIDLRPDGWSQLGLPVRINDGAILNPDTVRIHRGTQIENATGGAGNDVLIGNDAANRLAGRGGGDVFVLGPGSPDVIADFNAGEGDWIDISRLSAGFTGFGAGTDLFAAGFLRVNQSGQNAVLEYDADASATRNTWQALAVLENATASAFNSSNFAPSSSHTPRSTLGLTLTGTPGADALTGNVDDDTISGLAGNDVLNGGAGNDTLRGGTDADTLNGGAGDDRLFGDDGADRLAGGSGNDELEGGPGNDEFSIAAEGETGAGRFDGGEGADTFSLVAGTGAYSATITGGTGQDTYRITTTAVGATDRNFTVTDFVAGDGGDLIDLTSGELTLAGPMIVSGNSGGYGGGNPFAPSLGYLRLVPGGADTLLQWDRDGAAGAGATWVSILTLSGVSPTSLRAGNFTGGIEPDGSQGAGRVITGTSGNDSLLGGVDDDSISGLAGDDLLDGGLGGADRLDGGAGSDTLRGGAGADTLLGGDGNDFLYGGAGDDLLDAGAGDDFLSAGTGTDTLRGGEGADIVGMLFGPAVLGSSSIAGGGGQDTYRFQVLAGSIADRNLVVTDFVTGPAGDYLDLLSPDQALPGPMVVSTDTGNYRAGDPRDPGLGYLRIVQSGADALLQWDRDGASGTAASWLTLALLQNVRANDVVLANFAGRTLVGGEETDNLVGTWANDTISGLGGNDILDGREGADTMVGGGGADTYYVDDSGDATVETDSVPGGTLGFRLGLDLTSTIDTVVASVNHALATFVENLTLAPGSRSLAGTGNAQDNVLRGNAGANILDGAAGNDVLSGGAENDVLEGGPGIDTAEYSGNFTDYTIAYLPGTRNFSVSDHVAGRDGTDVVGTAERFKFADTVRHLVSVVRDGASSQEIAISFSGPEIPGVRIDYQFIGVSGNEAAAGTESNDFFNLLGGDDAVDGGAGRDILDGGTGSNFLSGNAGSDTFFLDGRGAVTTWSTLTDWEAGEQLAVWGWRGESRIIAWEEAGPDGYRGITMHADLDGDGWVDTSVTWTGKTQAELPVPVAYPEHNLLWFT